MGLLKRGAALVLVVLGVAVTAAAGDVDRDGVAYAVERGGISRGWTANLAIARGWFAEGVEREGELRALRRSAHERQAVRLIERTCSSRVLETVK